VPEIAIRSTGESAPLAAAELLRPRQRLVLQALTWSSGLTRTELAERLGLPKATLAGLVDSLVAAGLVIEEPSSFELGPPGVAGASGLAGAPGIAGGPGAPGAALGRRVGRPPRLLRLAGPVPATGAVVYSGGVLSAAVVSYAGEVRGRAAIVLGHRDIDEALVSAGLQVLEEARGRAPGAPVISSVVLGVPAPLGLVAPDLVLQLERRAGMTALVENDANLGALGEATFGAGQGIDTFLYVKLARNVGAGLIVGGRLHRGATGYAGELGHVQVRDDGPLCVCGGRGCLHGLLGDALVQAVQPAYERALSFRDVLDLAANGESGPRRVLEDTGRTLGRPLADFATLFNPEAIVVDGSFAPAVGYVIAGIRASLERYTAPVAGAAVSVISGALGDDADLLGAAALARGVVPSAAVAPA
jgi:predicted NBD/HSP70 family sugar kinase